MNSMKDLIRDYAYEITSRETIAKLAREFTFLHNVSPSDETLDLLHKQFIDNSLDELMEDLKRYYE